jgi:hypothetical protein
LRSAGVPWRATVHSHACSKHSCLHHLYLMLWASPALAACCLAAHAFCAKSCMRCPASDVPPGSALLCCGVFCGEALNLTGTRRLAVWLPGISRWQHLVTSLHSPARSASLHDPGNLDICMTIAFHCLCWHIEGWIAQSYLTAAFGGVLLLLVAKHSPPFMLL